MLYTIHGTHREEARGKAQSLVAALQKKKPDAAVFRIDATSLTADTLREYTESQGLFEKRYIVVLDHVFDDENAQTVCLAELSNLAASENIFIVLEGKLDAKTKKKLEKHSEKMQEFSEKVFAPSGREFNVFALTDAFGERNRIRLWVLYQEALRRGSVAEELHGILFWQVKAMRLASKTRSASESGLKPFVFSKAKKFIQNYAPEELEMKARELVELYHRARRGAEELPIALERFILGL